MFAFSSVRDPVAKFESGVRQIWARGGKLWNMSADELLWRQLAMPVGEWIDEHAEPNTWRLSGRLRGGATLKLDFVLKLEEIDEAWPIAAAEIVKKAAARPDARAFAAALVAPFPAQHLNQRSARSATGRSSRLSDPMIRRMCDSPHYADEWRCFDYKRPDACGPPKNRNRTRATPRPRPRPRPTPTGARAQPTPRPRPG